MTATKTSKKYELPEELQDPAKLPRPQPFGDEWAIIGQPPKPPTLLEFIFAVPLSILFVVAPIATFLEDYRFSESYGSLVLIVPFSAPFWYFGFQMWRQIYTKWTAHRRTSQFGPPILVLPAPRFRAGERAAFHFQRDLKPQTHLASQPQLQANLRCLEITRSTVGTDIRYDCAVLYTQHLGSRTLLSSTQVLEAAWSDTLPPHARPSLLSKDHSRVWVLEVRQDIPGQLSEITHFLIPVTDT